MKIFGIFLIIIGVLFIPILALSVLSNLIIGIKGISGNTAETIGYIIGTLFMAGLLSWLDYLLIKFGIKLMKNIKSKKNNEMNNIGRNLD
jgi:hypothetical protein